MLRELRFGLIKWISTLFGGSLRILDLRKDPAADQRILLPKRTIQFDKSRFTLIGEEPFWYRLNEITLDASYAIELKNAEVIGKGLLVNEAGSVVLESAIFQREYLRRTYQNHWLFFRKRMSGSHYAYALPLINYLDRNYFHWMMESIGRLALVRDRLNDAQLKVLVDGDAPRFVRDSITFLFGIPNDRIVA